MLIKYRPKQVSQTAISLSGFATKKSLTSVIELCVLTSYMVNEDAKKIIVIAFSGDLLGALAGF